MLPVMVDPKRIRIAIVADLRQGEALVRDGQYHAFIGMIHMANGDGGQSWFNLSYANPLFGQFAAARGGQHMAGIRGFRALHFAGTPFVTFALPGCEVVDLRGPGASKLPQPLFVALVQSMDEGEELLTQGTAEAYVVSCADNNSGDFLFVTQHPDLVALVKIWGGQLESIYPGDRVYSFFGDPSQVLKGDLVVLVEPVLDVVFE